MYFSMPGRFNSNLCYEMFVIYCKQILLQVQLHEKENETTFVTAPIYIYKLDHVDLSDV